ncbi:MAG TPA: SDR family NAD(P)-dependent oxidoreductase [Methanocella sp.]
MKKILVTGGAGFIGYNICRMLAEKEGNHIYIMDNLSKAGMDEEFQGLIKNRNVTFYNLDMTDPASFDRIQQEYDQIYHLAAVVGVRKVTENPDLTIRVNTLSTIYLLEMIKRAGNRPRILFTSSSENYAGSLKHCNVAVPTPENIPLCIEDIKNPRWSYAASKIIGEIACYHYAEMYGFESIIVRYHNVYGPRMGTQHVIPEFIRRLKDTPGRLDMFGGYQYRSFSYVTDAARMTIGLMNNDRAPGKVINIGNDLEQIRIADIGIQLCTIMGISPEIVEHGAPDGSVGVRMPDLTTIRELGAYVFDIPFHDGLLSTYEWYDQHLPGKKLAPAALISKPA